MMAEEAFALSPISARPTLPGEADYDAIREAFMETARGRWFLAEYAKRNRTADTSLVLEAVTRLEANLAAQKQAPALSLIAALGAIRSAVRQAKASAIEAMPRVDADEVLTGARNGTRIIREIAWTLRECGADTRICDLLDTQVKAIEAGQQALNGNGREDVLASYDLLMQRVEQMVDGSAATVAQAEPTPAAEKVEPVVAEAREASVTPLFKSQASEVLAETVTISSVEPPRASVQPPVAETVVVETVAETAAPVAEATAELAATMAEASAAIAADDVPEAPETAGIAEDEHDLAVLDMVAAEMGALDLSEPDVIEPQLAEPQYVEPEVMQVEAVAVQPAEPEALNPDLMTLAQIAEVALAPEPPQPDLVPKVEAAAPSLGAALIAGGVIADPNAPASDPLAPIRKMTQAEKIAFFS
ncbi:hypothetical protein SAMN05216374_3634 [Tardiphaga sp. OK246]|jgi:hypothetical protein|uniref:hypothetical protein n=1 Tax=Tardiphaga sp. OK246 TaxID=1855307 RepID=UPI000B638263|nr:hypothetical protein [Tardiphaga sp. OK246]SNT38424.1 hypothetical protein SAMN05216374_3634 [Tardiphaga sp. OK246]